MATPKKTFKRSVSHSLVDVEQTPTNHTVLEWSSGHEFLSPNEIHSQAIGLLFSLTTKRLINTPFTSIYRRSLKITWIDLLGRERRNLKANINSVEKCFIINRLIEECRKDPCKFAQQTGELYEEIKMRMSSTVQSTWSIEQFYNAVITWRSLQGQRRLFHLTHDEANRPVNLITLQQVATMTYSQVINLYRANPNTETNDRLKQFLQHCFIIVAQPSTPECAAATKYDKNSNNYSAKLYTRILCLLDPNQIEEPFTLSSVAVTLYLHDRHVDPNGEKQTALTWLKRTILDAEEQPKTVLYVELESIEMKKQDVKSARPLYSSKLCQLQFQIKIKIDRLNMEETFAYLSQPFGICSHAQYYPEYISRILLYDVAQMSQTDGSIIQPDTLTAYISRYHIRISGVELKCHTSEYIKDRLRAVYEEKKTSRNATSSEIYEAILCQIISQMEMYIDHPFLSMMYHDGLFLGICNSTIDQQLHGVRERPHILLRFNSLLTHQSTQQASVRFIVHNGQLTRATFHTKAFIDEMCRMICEATYDKAKKIRLVSETPDRTFHEFISYYDNELLRLHTAASPIKGAYQPFIPILWNTMRNNTEEQLPTSPVLTPESRPIDLSQARTTSLNQIRIDLSDLTDRSRTSNEKVTIQTDILVHHLVEKLFELFHTSSLENISSTSPHITQASTLLSTITHGDSEQQKQLISHLLYDYFQSQTHVEVATQTSASNNSPVRISDDD